MFFYYLIFFNLNLIQANDTAIARLDFANEASTDIDSKFRIMRVPYIIIYKLNFKNILISNFWVIEMPNHINISIF